MSVTNDPNFRLWPLHVQVASAGEEAIGLKQPLSMTLGDITDPEQAFGAAFFMWALQEHIQENTVDESFFDEGTDRTDRNYQDKYTTLCSTFGVELIGTKTFQIRYNPMMPTIVILAEGEAVYNRIVTHRSERGTFDWLGHSYNLDGITIRLKGTADGSPTFDISEGTDIEELYFQWEELPKNSTIPVFGGPIATDIAITTSGNIVLA